MCTATAYVRIQALEHSDERTWRVVARWVRFCVPLKARPWSSWLAPAGLWCRKNAKLDHIEEEKFTTSSIHELECSWRGLQGLMVYKSCNQNQCQGVRARTLSVGVLVHATRLHN